MSHSIWAYLRVTMFHNICWNNKQQLQEWLPLCKMGEERIQGDRTLAVFYYFQFIENFNLLTMHLSETWRNVNILISVMCR